MPLPRFAMLISAIRAGLLPPLAMTYAQQSTTASTGNPLTVTGGIQVFAGTVQGASQTYFTAGSTPVTLLSSDGSNNLILQAPAGQALKLLGGGGTGINVLTGGNAQFNGLVAFYNGITTAGLGVGAIYGATKQKSESATDASVVSYTPPATAGVYETALNLDCSASAAGVVAAPLTWKDANGVSHAAVVQTLYKVAPSGTVAGSQGPTLAANDVWDTGTTQISIDNSATAIVWGFTLTSGTTTCKVSATIKQVQ